jgi:hypothetical protein
MARRLPVIAVAVAVAAGVAAPGASAAPADTVTIPVSITVWSACPLDVDGEQVQLDGFMQLTHTFTTDAAGGYHEHFAATSHLEGTGLVSGDRYVSNNTDSIIGNYPADGTSVVVNVTRDRQVLTGPSSPGDDFSVRLMLTPGGYYVEEETCA